MTGAQDTCVLGIPRRVRTQPPSGLWGGGTLPFFLVVPAPPQLVSGAGGRREGEAQSRDPYCQHLLLWVSRKDVRAGRDLGILWPRFLGKCSGGWAMPTCWLRADADPGIWTSQHRPAGEVGGAGSRSCSEVCAGGKSGTCLSPSPGKSPRTGGQKRRPRGQAGELIVVIRLEWSSWEPASHGRALLWQRSPRTGSLGSVSGPISSSWAQLAELAERRGRCAASLARLGWQLRWEALPAGLLPPSQEHPVGGRDALGAPRVVPASPQSLRGVASHHQALALPLGSPGLRRGRAWPREPGKG